MKTFLKITAGAIFSLTSAAAFSCASCGCSLSSDWQNQGFSSDPGFRFDLRYDYLNQNQMRNGTGKTMTWPVDGHEQELYTKNQYLTASVDYTASPDWGVTVQLPYVDRTHATNGFAFDGSDAGASHTHSLGDMKVIGRYTGLTENHNLGIQFGLKLATGSHTENFNSGALAGQPLDRGLQPGSGTTDLIAGIFQFNELSPDWDYFVQAMTQLPLNHRDGYQPGKSLNLNAGIRYAAMGAWIPQLQLNGRISSKDSGVNASPDDSGGKTLYISPGLTWNMTERVRMYMFLQVPLYHNLNGYQLAPKYTVSVGTSLGF